MHLAGPNIALHFLCLFVGLSVCLCVCNYHMCNKYVMYAVAMRLYFGPLDSCFGYWCSYYEVQSRTVMILRYRQVKQRQHRCDDMRLTKSRSARSEQVLMISIEKLLVMPTEQLINSEWQPGQHLIVSKAKLVFRYKISDSLTWHYTHSVIQQWLIVIYCNNLFPTSYLLLQPIHLVNTPVQRLRMSTDPKKMTTRKYIQA